MKHRIYAEKDCPHPSWDGSSARPRPVWSWHVYCAFCDGPPVLAASWEAWDLACWYLNLHLTESHPS